ARDRRERALARGRRRAAGDAHDLRGGSGHGGSRARGPEALRCGEGGRGRRWRGGRETRSRPGARRRPPRGVGRVRRGGFTLLEMMAVALLTALVFAAAVNFYIDLSTASRGGIERGGGDRP